MEEIGHLSLSFLTFCGTKTLGTIHCVQNLVVITCPSIVWVQMNMNMSLFLFHVSFVFRNLSSANLSVK